MLKNQDFAQSMIKSLGQSADSSVLAIPQKFDNMQARDQFK